MLVPPLVGLFYVAVAEPGSRSIARTAVHQLLAALEDPLTLFSQRSPGKRAAGQLLSTKGKSGPHERVLSTVRDREQPPAADTPVPDTVAAIPIIPPQYEALPTEQTIAALPFVPPTPFIQPSFIPGGTSPQINPPGPPGPPGGPPPGGPPPGGPPPGGPPPGGPPPGGPPPGGPPPGGPPPGSPPPETPPIPIPEPSTWTLMFLGLFAVVAARRMRKPPTTATGG